MPIINVNFKTGSFSFPSGSSCQVSHNGRSQVHPGAMEKAAVRRHALSSQGALGSTASFLRSTGTLPTQPDKTRRLGYRAKHGYIMYWILVRRGGCKRPVSKGVTCGNLSITVSAR